MLSLLTIFNEFHSFRFISLLLTLKVASGFPFLCLHYENQLAERIETSFRIDWQFITVTFIIVFFSKSTLQEKKEHYRDTKTYFVPEVPD